MIERYELNKWLESFQTRMEDIHKAIKPNEIKVSLQTLSDAMQAPDFWSNTLEAKRVTKESSRLEKKLSTFLSLKGIFDDIKMLAEESKEDEELFELLELEMASFEKKMKFLFWSLKTENFSSIKSI